MSSQLWMLNSSLVGVLLATVFFSVVLRVDLPPRKKIKPQAMQVEEKQDAVPSKLPIEKIYQKDMFGTFVAKQEKIEKKTLVSPIPDFTAPDVTPTPDLPTYDFVPPLDVMIKGIIMADDEERCVAMIEDDTKKESLYHVGDKIKDAHVIKIAQNRIVFLRGANGQLETVYLRKDDAPIGKTDEKDKWKKLVRATEDDDLYELDPIRFKQEFDSLGNFLERASIVGAVYKKGSPIGIKIGSLDKGEIGEALGLVQGDVVVAINGIKTAALQDRIKIYNQVIKAKMDETVKVTVMRADEKKVLTYKLTKLGSEKPTMFGNKDKSDEEGLARSRLQEREKLIRDFREKHQSPDQNEAVARIRQRLLENLRSRVKDTRVR